MQDPKFKIGDMFYIVTLRNVFKEDRVYQYESGIQQYMVSGVTYQKYEYCDDRVGRPPTPRYSGEIVAYKLSTTNWINAVNEITEEALEEIYGKTPEESVEKALAIINSAKMYGDQR